jgi:hypothetical protein
VSKQRSTEFDTFDRAMGAILKADPKAVKASMEADKAARAARRQGTAQQPKVKVENAAKERWDGIAKAEKENPKLQVPY